MTAEEMAVALAKNEKDIKSLAHRVASCESENETTRQLAISVNQLAVNMEHMLREQKEQGQRLTVLERAPGEGYLRLKNTVIQCLTSSILGAILGAVMTLVLR
ncbi:MAG: hypothetical protein IJW46_05340 [Clostridia bacterium]|nr:hypothetical protein [Clostridia bacterium]